MTVYILEDDQNWQIVYKEALGYKFDLRLFYNIHDLTEALTSNSEPFVLVADLTLENESFLCYLRAHPQLPKIAKIIVVSANDRPDILEECFSLGVFDYLTKPINTQELTVKIKRLVETSEAKRTFMGLSIDRLSNRVFYNDSELQLTPREFQIVNYLLDRGESGIPKQELQQCIWKNTNVTSNTIEVHVCNLRKKLGTIGFDIVTQSPHTFCLLPKKSDLSL